jgi:hypothetical protein
MDGIARGQTGKLLLASAIRTAAAPHRPCSLRRSLFAKLRAWPQAADQTRDLA